MRSYILAIAVSMLLAAVYAFQNTGEITVHFLLFRRVFPQGVWEVVLFSIGAMLMWFFSVFASIETHMKHRKEEKERNQRISELEGERASLLNAFKYLPQGSESVASMTGSEEQKKSVRADIVAEAGEASDVATTASVGETIEAHAADKVDSAETCTEEEEKESGSI